MDYKIVTIEQKNFPEKMLKIDKVPQKIYAVGNIDLLYEDGLGIVGTRNPTEYGRKVCKEFAKEISLREITIISGMADGIDKTAHKTSIEYESRTIGVIGCGIDCYLENNENADFFKQVVKANGLILSEYDLGVEKSKENFPQRNRIIAALSEGVLVVEAAYRSGSSITAKWANYYGKKVFAIPGKISDKMSVGTNNLIKKGAILVTQIEEILKYYPQFANKKRKSTLQNNKKSQESNIKNEWKDIINALEKETLIIEELQLKTKKNTRELLKILSEMEMEGIVEQEIGIGYKIKSR